MVSIGLTETHKIPNKIFLETNEVMNHFFVTSWAKANNSETIEPKSMLQNSW